MYILITGALGYIGSITTFLLLNRYSNNKYILVDNLSNSCNEVLDKFKNYTNHFDFYAFDITDYNQMDYLFKKYSIDLVIHFAGLKSVKESFERIYDYYFVNTFGTMNLLEIMKKYNCKKIIFSSSACVYSGSETNNYREDESIFIEKISNPYGKTKFISEQILREYSKDIRVVILRYFNPVGKIENFYFPPKKIENLMDNIIDCYLNNKELFVFGNDYATPDGTCLRDFIHVKDLAESHIRSMEWLDENKISPFEIFNIGTGKGVSVLNLIQTFEKVKDIHLNYKIVARRQGDTPVSFANTEKANQILGWFPNKTLEDMCRDYNLS
jgi:UDP-glucose 4-epimerase